MGLGTLLPRAVKNLCLKYLDSTNCRLKHSGTGSWEGENSVFHPCPVESADVKPVDTKGQLYLSKRICIDVDMRFKPVLSRVNCTYKASEGLSCVSIRLFNVILCSLYI